MIRGYQQHRLCGALTLACALAAPAYAHAQAARVLAVQGTAIVQREGQSPRVLGDGEVLDQKDVISVAQKSHAMLEFRDLTRITLRPNTIFRLDAYSDATPREMVMGLLKGGLRAVTGGIAKQEPQAVRFQTKTAILGVRGTEFDLRLCENDCAAEERAGAATVPSNVAARVLEVKGSVVAGQGANASRRLVEGATVHVDEEVATSAGSHVVVAFRDGTRVTLAPESRLSVARFTYDEANPKAGRARLRLVSGSAHVWTGTLAKLGTDAFLFDTRLGTIHPHGTGFTVGSDAAKGADEVLVVHTWDGNIIIQTPTDRVEVKETESVGISIVNGRITLLQKPPTLDSTLPRPDGIQIDPATFGRPSQGVENGLYVWVRDGAVTLDQDNRTVEVKAGSAALATPERLTVLDIVPNFLRFDTTPRPNPAGATFQIPYFRARDGSVVGMCKP